VDQGNQPLRSVIVGFGRIGDTIRHDKKMAKFFPMASHAQVLLVHPGFDWFGIVDPAVKSTDWDVPILTLDQCAEAEFAVLAIPPGGRLGAIKALPNLKAVFVEKPMGDEKLLEYCEARDIAVHVNFWRRGDKLFRQLARFRLAACVGKPQAVFATYGNGLYNNGSHLVDFLRMLLGEVTEVKRTTEPVKLGIMGCSYPNVQDDWHVGFNLVCGDTPVSVLPLDFEHYREVGVDIWGTEGRITLFQESLSVFHFAKAPHEGMENQYEVESDNPQNILTTQTTALYNIYDGILSGKSLSTGRNALETHRVLDEVING